MVSGGSGITPFISIIRDLIFTSTKLDRRAPHVILVASFKNSSDLTMLDVILPASGASPYDISKLPLQIEAFVTREKEPGTDDYNVMIRDVRFKPRPTDAPISAILGPSSWLWLGAIIASSFVVFLILTGIITRYYVYPIDQNTGAIFSWSLKSALYILVVCFGIATTASASVLWNKKHNAMEAMQIQNMSGTDQRELESLPHHSLAQVTNVHYGERPNLKSKLFIHFILFKIRRRKPQRSKSLILFSFSSPPLVAEMLLECKGSSVGVMVCGPTELSNEVAAICGSGLAENLHFQSFSFSW